MDNLRFYTNYVRVAVCKCLNLRESRGPMKLNVTWDEKRKVTVPLPRHKSLSTRW